MYGLSLMRSFVEEFGGVTLFAQQCLSSLVRKGVRGLTLIEQIYLVGVRSLPTTLVTGGFVGAILAIQINLQLRDFGAQGFLGGLSTSTTVRDLGPVLIAFILSGKVGAFTSAEIATMRVTEQIDAIRCLGADPIEYLIVPRMVAVVISSFLLLIVGLMMTVAGGMMIASFHLGVNAQNYISNIASLVTGWSIGLGVVKSFVFGVLIAVICCFEGNRATGGAEGVGRAVRGAAVKTLLAIIIANFFISSSGNLLREMLGLNSL